MSTYLIGEVAAHLVTSRSLIAATNSRSAARRLSDFFCTRDALLSKETFEFRRSADGRCIIRLPQPCRHPSSRTPSGCPRRIWKPLPCHRTVGYRYVGKAIWHLANGRCGRQGVTYINSVTERRLRQSLSLIFDCLLSFSLPSFNFLFLLRLAEHQSYLIARDIVTRYTFC